MIISSYFADEFGSMHGFLSNGEKFGRKRGCKKTTVPNRVETFLLLISRGDYYSEVVSITLD